MKKPWRVTARRPLSESQIRRRHQHLTEVMKMLSQAEMAWSYKTNYLGAVCIYHQEGAKARLFPHEYKWQGVWACWQGYHF